MSDLVAVWNVPLSDNNYRVEFEHGTISGKRVIRVNSKEIFRKEWMFKLVGSEHFEIGVGSSLAKCEIRIDTCSGLNYEYSLKVNGKQLQRFKEKQKKNLKTWSVEKLGSKYRVVLDRELMNVWVNGKMPDVESVFVESGTEIRFQLEQTEDVESNNNTQNSNSLSSPSSDTLLLSRKPSRATPDDSTDFQHFQLQTKPNDAAICILSSGNKREGIVYSLKVGGEEVPELNDL